jgi:hypothetical protein
MARRPRSAGEQREPVNVDPPAGDRPRGRRPEVITLHRDDKRKRGSSRAARRLEDIEKRVSKAVDRVARAVDQGTSTYRKARDESEQKRRDGALTDFYDNVARGVSKTMSKASPALADVAKAFNTKGRRKQLRRVLKRLPRLPAIV